MVKMIQFIQIFR